MIVAGTPWGAGHIQLNRFRKGPTPHPFSYYSGTPPAARCRVRASRADTPHLVRPDSQGQHAGPRSGRTRRADTPGPGPAGLAGPTRRAPGFERGCQELLAEVAITVTACSTA